MRVNGETLATDTQIRAIRVTGYDIPNMVAEANLWLRQNTLTIGGVAVTARQAGVKGGLCEFDPPIPNDPAGRAAVNALISHLAQVCPSEDTAADQQPATAGRVDFSELSTDDNPFNTGASWQ